MNKILVNDIFKAVLHRDARENELNKFLTIADENDGINKILLALIQSKEYANIQKKLSKLLFAPGHFYSPIVDVDLIKNKFNQNIKIHEIPGININDDLMLSLWGEFSQFLCEIPFPEERHSQFKYFFENTAFSFGDGSILYAMLRKFKPKRYIEIGSGYSSACAFDTISNFLDGDVELTFIEPYPDLLKSLLGDYSSRSIQIIQSQVQEVDLSVFKKLVANDILFIDSTHVMKTGSDVCFELFDILPALNPGVIIHFHDIPWPFEYGKKWVLEQNRSWNEAYALRSFLMYNNQFEIIFFNDYFVKKHTKKIQAEHPKILKNGGASIWIRKV